MISKLRPGLEARKNQRLAGQRFRLVNSRRQVIRYFFQEIYKRSLLPSTWAFFPPTHIICGWKEFSVLANSPDTVHVTADTCAAAVALAPRHADEWVVERMKELAAVLHSSSQHSRNAADVTQAGISLDINALDRATSVFECVTSPSCPISAASCLIGWERAGAHISCDLPYPTKTRGPVWYSTLWRGHKLRLSQRGFDAATALLELAGHDSQTTLARDFDREPLRFVCLNCTSSGLKGRQALKWRECVRCRLVCPYACLVPC